MNITKIIKKYNLKIIKYITNNTLICVMDSTKVILKTKIEPNNNTMVKNYLDHLNSINLENISFPKYIYISEKENYIIMSHNSGNELTWSEFDHESDTLGGRALSIDDSKLVIKLMKELESIDTSPLEKICETSKNKEHKDPFKWYLEEIPSLSSIETLLNKMVKRSLINKAFKEEIYSFLKRNFKSFFTKNLIVSNFDFYPRNILKTNNDITIIDWDRAGLETKERMYMTFWVHMFGNTKFQKDLMSFYIEDENYNVDRYRMGLILILLELIEIWWSTKRCNMAFDVCVDYLVRYKEIIK